MIHKDLAAFDPLSEEAKQRTQEISAAMRAGCPVHHHRMPEAEIHRQNDHYLIASPTTEFWSVFNYADAVRVLQDPDTFSSREGPGPERMAPMSPDGMLLTADAPAHRRQRRIAAKAFLPRIVDNRVPTMRAVTDDLIDGVADQGFCDLMEAISFPLTVAMITDFFGVGADRREDITRWGAASIGVMGGDQEQVAAGVLAVNELFQLVQQIILDRRATLGAGGELPDDLLSAMIAARDDDGGPGFADEEILMAAHQFLTAGFESTATAIGSGIFLLCSHREQRAKLEADWSLIDGAVEETLRYEAPIEGTFRTTTKPVTLSGVEIPAGAKVRVVYASANRDEARFEDAASFRIDRPAADLRKHVAFATGPHACLGAALARSELRVAIETILRRLPGLELAADHPPVRSQALTVNGFASLPIRWNPEKARPRLWQDVAAAGGGTH